jgi:NAD(P)-dependent dehydrogenase (short-subunit alcohol dehydrogenase family)
MTVAPYRMDGRTVLVTGGNTGVGKETAVALAAVGATVVFTARDPDKGEAARTEIRERSGNPTVDVMPLDLASFASVRELVDRFRTEHESLHVLVNNAGVMLSERRESVDGNEMTLQVNHLAPFLLTTLLREQLKTAGGGRVVNVSSVVHTRARRGLDFDDLQSTRLYRGGDVYCRTKLANILFTRELARRWDADGISANAAHPGFVKSGFGRDGDTRGFESAVLVVLRPFASSPERGARTPVFLASASEVDGLTGGYWVKCKPTKPSAAASDDAAAARLWEMSERLVA